MRSLAWRRGLTTLLIAWVTACSTGDRPGDPVANATYQGIYEYPVRLEEGRYEGEPFQPGAASRPTLVLLKEPRATGDLNGDGLDETVVLLAESSGGSGVFVYLAVLGWQGEEPHNLATRLLGDRIQVESLAVEDDRLQIAWLDRGAGRSMNPTHLELVLTDGALTEPARSSPTDAGTAATEALDPQSMLRCRSAGGPMRAERKARSARSVMSP